MRTRCKKTNGHRVPDTLTSYMCWTTSMHANGSVTFGRFPRSDVLVRLWNMISRSNLYIKVIGSGSMSQEQKTVPRYPVYGCGESWTILYQAVHTHHTVENAEDLASAQSNHRAWLYATNLTCTFITAYCTCAIQHNPTAAAIHIARRCGAIIATSEHRHAA